MTYASVSLSHCDKVERPVFLGDYKHGLPEVKSVFQARGYGVIVIVELRAVVTLPSEQRKSTTAMTRMQNNCFL
jgi:hypothetical protein